jgi:predicted small secreted protein
VRRIKTNQEKTYMLKRLIMILFAASVVIAAGTGCRTAHGFGEDMEKAGDSIQDKTSN